MDMLWYDGGPAKEPQLEKRVIKAAEYYTKKYKVLPARVLLNPAEVPAEIKTVEAIIPNWGTAIVTFKVEAASYVMKQHLVLAGVHA